MLDRPIAETRPPAERRPAAAAMPGAPPIEPEGLNLAALLGALRRRRGVLIACLLLFPLVAFVAAKTLTPRYTAATTVMFEPTEYAARELQSILRDESTTDAVLASQVEIIRSLSVARRLVRRFGLVEREEFAWWLQDRASAEGWAWRAQARVAEGLAQLSPMVGEMLAPSPPPDTPPGELAEIQAAEACCKSASPPRTRSWPPRSRTSRPSSISPTSWTRNSTRCGAPMTGWTSASRRCGAKSPATRPRLRSCAPHRA
jgi:hypothetical protein